jgi:hypothetical protein
MRTAVGATGLAALLLLATGCSSSAQDTGTPAGCGLVGQARVVGLLGDDVDTVLHGSAHDLRVKHRRLVCTNVDPQHSKRYVTVTATYHPRRYQLPRHSCDAGWVFAGSVEKYAPACQETVGRQSTTRLVVRWQPYLVRVTVSRLDKSWAGDPELALAMSRELARHLRVKEAAGNA